MLIYCIYLADALIQSELKIKEAATWEVLQLCYCNWQ